jgi:hypothetical protein
MGVLRRFSREEEGDKINLKINGDFFIHFFIVHYYVLSL